MWHTRWALIGKQCIADTWDIQYITIIHITLVIITTSQDAMLSKQYNLQQSREAITCMHAHYPMCHYIEKQPMGITAIYIRYTL